MPARGSWWFAAFRCGQGRRNRDGSGGMMRMMRAFPKFLAAGLLAVGGLAGMPALAQAPRPWEMGMQPAFSPVKDRHHRAARPGADHHHADHPVRRRAAGLGDGALQRQGQPGAQPHQPQHHHRSRLDAAAGADPSGHRDPVLPAGLLRGPHQRGRPDGEGDRTSVVLGIHLPGQRQPGFQQQLSSRTTS